MRPSPPSQLPEPGRGPGTTDRPPPGRRRLRVARRLALFLALALVFTLVIQDRLARPSLVGFDPARMGRLEASMWRSYYEHRWASLALDGLRVSCGEYGFSWWDGTRASILAARAALHFRGDTDDPRCRPLLERYYSIIRDALGATFDVAEAARLELEWWRERRRGLGPEDYARTIAANAALVYGLAPESLREASRLRAEAMFYRDRHGRDRGMTEADWSEVARRLGEAYLSLRAAAGAEGAATGTIPPFRLAPPDGAPYTSSQMSHPRFAAVLLFSAFAGLAHAEERSWTNSAGKTIVAALVEVAGDKAVLQMQGKNFEVPVASLSPDDQKFIAEWKKGDMADPSGDAGVKPNWDGPWPAIVSVDVDQPIEVIKEDAASGEYIYASPHYEFICDVKLNTSVVKRFSLLFEATNQVCRELPLGMVKPFRQERHKIHLFETREAYVAKGGPPDSAGVYISRGGEGDILVPLTSLGVKKVGSNYSVDYDKENTTLSHEITHQITDYVYYAEGSRGWFTEGLAEYIAQSGYRSGKFNINDLAKLKAYVTAYGEDNTRGRALGDEFLAPNLEEFFLQSYDSFLNNANFNYGLASLVVYYFFHMDGNRDAANIKAFLKALKEEKSPPELYEPLLAGRSWDEMEAAITQGWRSRGVKINFR